MSRLTDLIAQVRQSNPALAKDLEAEYRVLADRVPFGLNFERHLPERVQLPDRTIRRGDKVVFRAPRGETDRGLDRRTWRVTGFGGNGGDRPAQLVEYQAVDREPETACRLVRDLVVVAEFRDPIYPGLRSTGTVERGGDKPFHTVINGENYHALEALLFAYEGLVDCIYIDPPYNTRDKDWKYNNDYVDGDDSYRHSKWLAMMERRLKLAKRLLNPTDSVLIVTIDENEYLRLGLLLKQIFADARVQMISSAINPKGSPRSNAFSRVEEYIFFVALGSARPAQSPNDMLNSRIDDDVRVEWVGVRRRGSGWQRSARPGLFYPIFVEPAQGRIVDAGDPLPLGVDRDSVSNRPGLFTVWPMNSQGQESRWQMTPSSLMKLVSEGFVRSSIQAKGGVTMDYLSAGQRKQIKAGVIGVIGRDENGTVIVEHQGERIKDAKTLWNLPSHDATAFGSKLLSTLMPDRRFPFPKSLYAVEDTVRFFVGRNPDALILDFFAGSGTTAHAVMRLNRQDGGRRRSILVTNNEVSADEQKQLRAQMLQPGDADWERWGIAEYITKPRIRAAITGQTPDGQPIKGGYRFTDESPMADGFAENAEFFDLTYEDPRQIANHRAFRAIAPLLWLRAGAAGRRIEQVDGLDVADTYGVLVDLDQASTFVSRIEAAGRVRMAFIVTDDDRRFQMICAGLPERVEPVRLYESYLTNFEINTGRGEA